MTLHTLFLYTKRSILQCCEGVNMALAATQVCVQVGVFSSRYDLSAFAFCYYKKSVDGLFLLFFLLVKKYVCMEEEVMGQLVPLPFDHTL